MRIPDPHGRELAAAILQRDDYVEGWGVYSMGQQSIQVSRVEPAMSTFARLPRFMEVERQGSKAGPVVVLDLCRTDPDIRTPTADPDSDGYRRSSSRTSSSTPMP